MKQILATTAGVYLDQVPTPHVGKNEILVQTHFSLISTGTETAGMTAANNSPKSKSNSKLKNIASNVTAKAKTLYNQTIKNPENITKTFKMLANEGWDRTVEEIKKALGAGHIEGWPTGYSASGIVIQVGENITDLQVGDQVACAGAGKANHAEFIAIPRNLAVKLPHGVSLEDAASVTLGSIAMQGVRQASPQLGETVAVLGLGLIGQITVQLLKAAGVKVIGIDLDDHRLETAKKAGADFTIHGTNSNPIEDALRITKQNGVDATIITAATQSSIPLQQSMEMTRKKGTVVIVGAVGLNLERSPFYQKEIDLKISCSYGPGRYDKNYEEKGIDYPYSYVRWTENRNMQSYLQLIADKKLDFSLLAEKTYEIDNAPNAYQELVSAQRKPLAVLLKYPANEETPKTRIEVNPPSPLQSKNQNKNKANDKINLAVIGAGAFFQGMHLPILQQMSEDFHFHTIWNRSGTKAKSQATHLQFQHATTSFQDIFENKEIDSVFICTRHDNHAELVLKAIKSGKSVFVEKPLATTQEDLEKIQKAYEKNPVPLLTGFNRRFSPHAQAIKKAISNHSSLNTQTLTTEPDSSTQNLPTSKSTTSHQNPNYPIIVNYRINGGFIPADHWVQTEEGAGRIIGEACHMFDMFNYFTDSTPVKIQTSAINPGNSKFFNHDNFTTTITYQNGSICTLTYTALGNKSCPKERVEVFFNGQTYIIDDYKNLEVYTNNQNNSDTDTKGFTSSTTNKGHQEEITQWKNYLKGTQKHLPITIQDQLLATQISFKVANQVKN